jgi:hypothetical protein
MKNSIKLSALLLLFSAGLFAAAPKKPVSPKTPSIKGMVTFSTLATRRGIEVKVDKNAPGKAIVMIYNWNNDVVWKDVMKNKPGMEKGMDKAFILNQLDNGNYTVEVTLNKQVVKKIAHVYYRGDAKWVSIRG